VTGLTVEIRITNGMLEALLNATGGNPDYQTEKLRSLVQAVHRARLGPSQRWVLELTEEDLHTLHFVYSVWFLNHPELETRFSLVLVRQSPVYERLYREAKARG
jgi:hypothetical protein